MSEGITTSDVDVRIAICTSDLQSRVSALEKKVREQEARMDAMSSGIDHAQNMADKKTVFVSQEEYDALTEFEPNTRYVLRPDPIPDCLIPS